MVRSLLERSSPFQRLRDEMEQLFEEMLPTGSMLSSARDTFPSVNLWEDDEAVYAEAELPGFKIEELEIAATTEELSLKGERKDPNGSEAWYHRRERGTGSFARSVRLGCPIQPDRVQATLADGVLTITMPKAEAVRPRKVQIRVAGK